MRSRWSAAYNGVPPDGCGIPAGAPGRGRSDIAHADRRGIYQPAFLWQSADGRVLAWSRPCRQPQARAAPDAQHGAGGHGARAEHEQGTPSAQGLSVPVARRAGDATEPSVVDRHHLHPVGAGLCLSGAIIDWYSRKVLSWRISNSMDASFCVDCLEDALRHHGRPEVFNSDQGSQFTSTAFTDVLKREGVTISMDGRGRALDNIFVERLWRNVKYEDVYLKGYANMAELMVGLAQYFAFYNAERPHQSLGYQTPDQVYRDGVGGGALIVDRFGDDKKSQEESNTGQRRAAVEAVETGTA